MQPIIRRTITITITETWTITWEDGHETTWQETHEVPWPSDREPDELLPLLTYDEDHDGDKLDPDATDQGEQDA